MQHLVHQHTVVMQVGLQADPLEGLSKLRKTHWQTSHVCMFKEGDELLA